MKKNKSFPALGDWQSLGGEGVEVGCLAATGRPLGLVGAVVRDTCVVSCPKNEITLVNKI